MKKPVSLIKASSITIISLIGASHALLSTSLSSSQHHDSTDGPPKSTVRSSSRRSFLQTSAASILSTTLVPSTSAASPANAAWLDINVLGKNINNNQADDDNVEFTYDRFRDLVQSKKIKSVQFSWNGSSLTCVDSNGKQRFLDGLPDDPTLLSALVNAGIATTVDDFPYEKHMSSSGWFRDSLLHDDTLTEEEKYKYRGYKTFRENIPENRVYIPSNLISN